MLQSMPEIVIPIRLGASYCYFIPSPAGGVLIDAGYVNKHLELKSVLTAHEHDMTDIRYIILTHTHHDHVGSLAEIKKRSGAKIIVGAEEASCLKRGRTPLPRGTGPIAKMMVQVGRVLKMGAYPPVEPDILIEQETTLSGFAFDLQIIPTPGHTLGSLTIIINQHLALVGDTMFNIRTDTVYPPFADNELKLLQSWETLLNTACDIFYPGHGPPFRRSVLEHSYKSVGI